MIKLMRGDCLELMRDIPDASVDMVLCDLPYGTTDCTWDSVIPFDNLWYEYKRIAKPKAAIVLTGSQPFTSALVTSNLSMFRYSLVWDKVNRFTGHLNAKKMPMRSHEDILVFYSSQPIFNPQKRLGVPYKTTRKGPLKIDFVYGGKAMLPGESNGLAANPGSIIREKGQVGRNVSLHPTQKPVALMEYLIKTYTNEGDVVLDNCMGSGTTGVACVNTGRSFIGMELDEGYFAIAKQRIEEAKLSLDVKLPT